MQADLMKKPMTIADIVKLTDAYSVAGKKRGEYKKKEKATNQ